MDEQGNEHVEELKLEPTAVVRNRRPRALWAVLAAAAVAAGALVVTSANDDGNQSPGLPVDLASATAARESGAAADAMYAWITYVAGDDLPALGGEARAYRLRGNVDEPAVRRLAEALELEGEVRSNGDGGWTVAGAGGLGRLDVYRGGGAYWSFFAGHRDCVDADGSIGGCTDGDYACEEDTDFRCAYPAGGAGSSPGKPLCEGGVECVEPTTTTYAEMDRSECPPGADCATPPDECDDTITTVAPPADADEPVAMPPLAACAEPLPDLPPLEGEEDARRIALEVVEASGADVDGARVTAQDGGESRSWYVTVEPEVDSVPSGLQSFVEVSDGGVVVSGNGILGHPEELGEYPLLDTRAAIDRANAQMNGADKAFDTPGVAADDTVSSTTGGTDGGTDVGGTDDGTITTVIGNSDPCAVPEGASDGCGGTTGCGDDGCVAPDTTMPPCKVQPDGRDICEYETCDSTDAGSTCEVPPTCPSAVGSEDIAVGAPDSIECTPPPPCAPPGAEGPPESRECPPIDPPIDPMPEPQPLEIALVDAEPALMLLAANDGSTDAYLVPAYRFTDADGGQVDLPAVADEALTGSVSTDTTVPDTVVPDPVPLPEPQPCEVLEEGDDTGTTHTIQTCPTPNEDPRRLGEGEEPVVGVAYYVDLDLECELLDFGGDLWINEDGTVHGWHKAGEQFEGGTFTLSSEDQGTLVGDAAGTKVAEFRPLGPAEDVFCEPEARS